MSKNNFLEPTWPAPSHIKAYITLSSSDDPRFNSDLKTLLDLPNEPIWLTQTHGTLAIEAKPEHRHHEADASFSDQPNQVCAILTADCLPLLICNPTGTEVAAIHAGWRGLLKGVIESTLDKLSSPHHELLVWLGPAISQPHFEVGEEVRSQFIQLDDAAEQAFIPSPNQRWLADLYALARLRLKKYNISSIYGGEFCTYRDTIFYSYRRDGAKTGRMASLIWIKD